MQVRTWTWLPVAHAIHPLAHKHDVHTPTLTVPSSQASIVVDYGIKVIHRGNMVGVDHILAQIQLTARRDSAVFDLSRWTCWHISCNKHSTLESESEMCKSEMVKESTQMYFKWHCIVLKRKSNRVSCSKDTNKRNQHWNVYTSIQNSRNKNTHTHMHGCTDAHTLCITASARSPNLTHWGKCTSASNLSLQYLQRESSHQ